VLIFRIDKWDNPEWKGIQIYELTDELVEILRAFNGWSQKSGKAVVINAIDDGKHGKGSIHHYSGAVDGDDEQDDPADLVDLYVWVRQRLKKKGYDVVKESTHIHVEHDPK